MHLRLLAASFPTVKFAPRAAAHPSIGPRCVLLGAVLLCTSCSAGERATQCNLLARQVNQALRPVKEYTAERPQLSRGNATPEEYSELAARYSALSKATRAAELSDERIVDLRDDYAALFEDTASASTNLQKARADNDLTARSRAVSELKRLERREDSLLKRADALCEPR